MPKSATEIMQEAMLAVVVDAIVALKDASRGVPNTLLRDLNAIHGNTTFADLPPALQSAITAGVRSGFTRLLKEGYSVSLSTAAPPPPRQPEFTRRDRPGAAPPPRGGKPGGTKSPPRGDRPQGGRPRGKPGPRSR